MREAATALRALQAEIARLHARLEDDHVYRMNPDDPDGEFIREDVEPGSIPDGIEARDATIGLLDGHIAKLLAERERLRGIVSDGLDLCVRGRVLDGAEQAPPLWIVDAYSGELSAWESRARAAFAKDTDDG